MSEELYEGKEEVVGVGDLVCNIVSKLIIEKHIKPFDSLGYSIENKEDNDFYEIRIYTNEVPTDYSLQCTVTEGEDQFKTELGQDSYFEIPKEQYTDDLNLSLDITKL